MIGHNFQKKKKSLKGAVQRCVYNIRGFKKICWCHYFFPASFPGLPSLPPPTTPVTRSAGSSQLDAREARFDCNANPVPVWTREGRVGPGWGVDESCREGCRGASSERAGVPREGSPQCTRTIKPNAQLPRPLFLAPWIPWKGQRRRELELARALSPARVRFSADNYISPSPFPSFIPSSLGEPERRVARGFEGARTRWPEFPQKRGEREVSGDQTPPPTLAVGLD